MSWEFRPVFDAAHRAALDSGKNLIYVCPPAPWALVPLFAEIPAAHDGLANLVLVPDVTDAVELASHLAAAGLAGPAWPATGLTRTARLLQARAVQTLVTTPADALALTKRAVLKGDAVRRVVVCWPDLHAALGALEALDLALAEAGGAARVVASADPDGDREFIERHARRAPLVVGSRPPPAPIAPARFVVIGGGRLGWAARSVLDTLDPAAALLWDPVTASGGRWRPIVSDPTLRISRDPEAVARVDLAVAARLPSAEAFRALARAAREIVVLVRPTQVAYLERLAAPLKAVHLAAEADRARDAAARLRAALRERLAAGGLTDRLLVLAPLFDEYDAALVAAAASAGAPSGGAGGAGEAAAAPTDLPTWAALRFDVGRRDGVRPADMVGVLLHAAGLPKGHVGLVDIRDRFTLVYVRAEAAERAVRGVSGELLKGKRVTARLDRR